MTPFKWRLWRFAWSSWDDLATSCEYSLAGRRCARAVRVCAGLWFFTEMPGDQADPHTPHCRARMSWGDGECECRAAPPRSANPMDSIDSEILRRHYAMREEMVAAFIEETRTGPKAVAIVREGSYPAACEWPIAIGGRWRRRWARLRLLLSPSMRRHIREYADRFKLYGLRTIPATETCLVMEPTAGYLMQVRFEPRRPEPRP